MNEGLAEWFEARATGKRHLTARELAVLQQLYAQGGLWALAQLSAPTFAGMDGQAAGVAYLQSYALFEYLARVSGERALRELVVELVRTRNLARSLERAFRRSLPELEAGFLAELG
jgi:hypothetical protein